MATFSSAISALVAHRDTLFLQKIAEDYSLNFEELSAKFITVQVPRKKREIKVKVSADGKEIRCQGLTAKKEQCSFGPLPGKCFCKRHEPKETETPKVSVNEVAMPLPLDEEKPEFECTPVNLDEKLEQAKIEQEELFEKIRKEEEQLTIDIEKPYEPPPPSPPAKKNRPKKAKK
jgi:hypothetical protein